MRRIPWQLRRAQVNCHRFIQSRCKSYSFYFVVILVVTTGEQIDYVPTGEEMDKNSEIVELREANLELDAEPLLQLSREEIDCIDHAGKKSPIEHQHHHSTHQYHLHEVFCRCRDKVASLRKERDTSNQGMFSILHKRDGGNQRTWPRHPIPTRYGNSTGKESRGNTWLSTCTRSDPTGHRRCCKAWYFVQTAQPALGSQLLRPHGRQLHPVKLLPCKRSHTERRATEASSLGAPSDRCGHCT